MAAIGIDYSGAETTTSNLKGLRVYLAEGEAPPVEVPPLILSVLEISKFSIKMKAECPTHNDCD